MKSTRIVLAVFVVALIPLIAAAHWAPVVTAAPLGGTSAQAAPTVIELKATKYKFTPETVNVPLNATVQLKITAADRDHGFEIDGVKDSCVKIPKGETKTVEYKATKAGTIKFKCCDFCGLGHGGMDGKIIVK